MGSAVYDIIMISKSNIIVSIRSNSIHVMELLFITMCKFINVYVICLDMC
jgi:hypothetical protein